MRKAILSRGLLVAGSFLIVGCGEKIDAAELDPIVGDFDRADPLVVEAIERALDAIRTDPGNVELRGKLAMIYHANALTDLAEPAYLQMLQIDPSNPRWWYYLGTLRTEVGDPVGAIDGFENSIRRDATYAPAHWQLGFRMLDLGRVEDAESAFQKAIEVKPEDATGRVGLARLHLQCGQYEEAAQILEPLVANNPGIAYLHQLLGSAYQHLGRDQEAQVHLFQATGRLPIWPDPWTEDLQDHGASYQAIFGRADDHISAGRTGQALAVLEQLRSRRPDDPVLLTKIAEAHLARGDLDQALSRLEAAIALDPDSFAANYNLARVYRQKNDLWRASKHIDRAIQANPQVGPAYLERALIESAAHDWSTAERSLLAAVANGSTEVTTQLTLAQVQFQLSKWPELAETLERLLQVDPNHVEALAMLAWARIEMGDLARARQAIEKARSIDPRSPHVERATQHLREVQPGR